MGKKLVVQGADFSENGFVVNVEENVITNLYDKNGNVVNSWPIESSVGAYWYNKSGDNQLQSKIGDRVSCRTAKIPVEDYTQVKVETTISGGYYNATVSGFIVLACLDANDNFLGGFTTTDTAEHLGNGVNLTPIGTQGSGVVKEMDIPAGTVNIVSCWDSNVSNSPVGKFKITLYKEVEQ